MQMQVELIKLENELEKLFDILKFPGLYLANFFDELRNEIDLEFESHKLSATLNQNNLIKDNHKLIIERAKLFEKDCIQQLKDVNDSNTNLFTSKYKQIIESIQAKFGNFKSRVDNVNQSEYELEFKNLIDLAYDTLNEMESYLFNNKSIFFLNDSKKINEKRLVLIIINDNYLNKNSLLFLK